MVDTQSDGSVLSSLDLPWAIVDGAWAERKPELLGTLRERGTKLLIDTHGWRFRYDTALDVEKLRAASWAPTSPISPMDKTTGAALVQASLRAQAELEAGAYFLPGWLPTTPGEDLRPAYEQIVTTASQFADVPPRPFVLFVGGHTKGLDQLVTLLEDLPHFISGIYLHPGRPDEGRSVEARDVDIDLPARGIARVQGDRWSCRGGHLGASCPWCRRG